MSWYGRSGPASRRPREDRRGDRDVGVTVAPIQSGEVVTWVESVLRCFFPEPTELPDALRDGAIAMASIPAASCWLARVDRRIAGGGALVIHDGLALVCGDGTLPEFRSRGVQTALLAPGSTTPGAPAATWP